MVTVYDPIWSQLGYANGGQKHAEFLSWTEYLQDFEDPLDSYPILHLCTVWLERNKRCFEWKDRIFYVKRSCLLNLCFWFKGDKVENMTYVLILIFLYGLWKQCWDCNALQFLYSSKYHLGADSYKILLQLIK